MARTINASTPSSRRQARRGSQYTVRVNGGLPFVGNVFISTTMEAIHRSGAESGVARVQWHTPAGVRNVRVHFGMRNDIRQVHVFRGFDFLAFGPPRIHIEPREASDSHQGDGSETGLLGHGEDSSSDTEGGGDDAGGDNGVGGDNVAGVEPTGVEPETGGGTGTGGADEVDSDAETEVDTDTEIEYTSGPYPLPVPQPLRYAWMRGCRCMNCLGAPFPRDSDYSEDQVYIRGVDISPFLTLAPDIYPVLRCWSFMEYGIPYFKHGESEGRYYKCSIEKFVTQTKPCPGEHDCPICMRESLSDVMEFKTCGHKACSACMFRWLNTRRPCACHYCRGVIPNTLPSEEAPVVDLTGDEA